ncbi:MAG: hypothetical protein A2885_13535 [Sphingopyxis sp. RIFCSPHIGHO2_01_FULL_65_24]|nr:MAG: hypothetical protein A2885_13535 [Sphingopyxis sp. RIFCSPHIGHO2_01_FULL_65_24]
MIGQHGGRAQCGWMLSELPGHFIEALHHVVWETPDGKLLDVTAAAYPAMTQPVTDFILDRKTVLGPYDPCIASIFHQIDREQGTKEYISLTIKRMVLRGKANAILIREQTKGGDGRIFADPNSAYAKINAELATVDYRRDSYLVRMNAGDFSRLLG